MKKIATIGFILISFVFVAYKVFAAVNQIGLKYTVNVSNNGQSIQYTIYQKGSKTKMVNNVMTVYSDSTTNQHTIYMPQQKMAIIQKTNPAENVIIDSKTINKYIHSFTKIGTKTINGYPCTAYKNTQGIEACVSEAYGLVIAYKTPTNSMSLSNISKTPIADTEFQLPAGVKVQNTNALIQQAINKNNTTNVSNNSVATSKTNSNTPYYHDWMKDSKNLPNNNDKIDFSELNKTIENRKNAPAQKIHFPDNSESNTPATSSSQTLVCSAQRESSNFKVEVYKEPKPKTLPPDGLFWAYYKKACQDKGGRLPSPQELADVAASVFGTNIEVNNNYSNLKITPHGKALLSQCVNDSYDIKLGKYGSSFYSNDPGQEVNSQGIRIPSDVRTHAAASMGVNYSYSALIRGENPNQGFYSHFQLPAFQPTLCYMCVFGK